MTWEKNSFLLSLGGAGLSVLALGDLQGDRGTERSRGDIVSWAEGSWTIRSFDLSNNQ